MHMGSHVYVCMSCWMTFCTVEIQLLDQTEEMQDIELYVCVFIINFFTYFCILRQVIPIVLSVQSKCTTFQSNHNCLFNAQNSC